MKIEEKESLHTLKIINPNMKIKKRLKFKNNKALIITFISVATIVLYFLIMLLIEKLPKRKIGQVSQRIFNGLG